MTTQHQCRKNASYAQTRAAKCKDALTKGLWQEVAGFWQQLNAQDERGSLGRHGAAKRRKHRSEQCSKADHKAW